MDDADRTIRYQALDRLAARWASHDAAGSLVDASRDLTRSEFRVFSQNGEDGVIEEVARRIGLPERRFVEFGTESGIEGNCVFLAEVLGWSGLFIEADPTFFRRLQQRYAGRPAVHTVNARVSPENINEIIAGAGLAGDISVLSIDIDGHDFWLWKAISIVRPRLVVIEYNASIPDGQLLVQPLSETRPWSGTDAFGASLSALEHLGAALGYDLVHTDLTGVNAFFVRSDLAAAIPTGEDVPRRAANYFFSGYGHPADETARNMINPFSS